MKRKDYIPANLKGYFTMAIEVQRHAFKPSFATYKLNQSCETLVRCGFCGSHRECHKCALQVAHDETLKALNNPEEVQRRYNAYVRRMDEKRQGVVKSVDKKGRVILVLHSPKPMKNKKEEV